MLYNAVNSIIFYKICISICDIRVPDFIQENIKLFIDGVVFVFV